MRSSISERLLRLKCKARQRNKCEETPRRSSNIDIITLYCEMARYGTPYYKGDDVWYYDVHVREEYGHEYHFQLHTGLHSEAGLSLIINDTIKLELTNADCTDFELYRSLIRCYVK